MRLSTQGGLGDEMMATALVREKNREAPDEMIRIRKSQFREIWRHNKRLGRGKTDDGRSYLIRGVQKKDGSFWEMNGRTIGIKEILDKRPEYTIELAEQKKARELIFDGRPIVAMDIWAGWEAKRWDRKRFIEVTRILKHEGWKVIEVGFHKCEPIGADQNLVGKLDPRESIAVIDQIDVYLGNDSACYHMAAAVHTPHVILFGHTRGYGINYDDTIQIIPPSECEKGCGVLACFREYIKQGPKCLNEIEPRRVAEAVMGARKD